MSLRTWFQQFLDRLAWKPAKPRRRTPSPRLATRVLVPEERILMFGLTDDAYAMERNSVPAHVLVLANDNATSGPLEITGFSQPLNGGSVSLLDNPNGPGTDQLIFTVDPEYTGNIVFTYTAQDATGSQATANVNATVTTGSGSGSGSSAGYDSGSAYSTGSGSGSGSDTGSGSSSGAGSSSTTTTSFSSGYGSGSSFGEYGSGSSLEPGYGSTVFRYRLEWGRCPRRISARRVRRPPQAQQPLQPAVQRLHPSVSHFLISSPITRTQPQRTILRS